MRITQSTYARVERLSLLASQAFAVLCMSFIALALTFGLLGTGALRWVSTWLLFAVAFVPYCVGHNYIVKAWLARRVAS